MHKCFLTAIIFLSLFSLELFAQHTPLDRCVNDCLVRVLPHKNPAQKAIIYLETAELIQNSMPQKAFCYLIAAFKISLLEKNDSLKAMTRIYFGDYYTMMRKFMQAHENYLAAWRTYQRIGDTAGQINSLLKIGSTNRSLRNYQKALIYIQKGMELTYTANNQSINGMLYSELGLTYQSMGLKKAALYFFNRALFVFRQAGDKANECRVQNNIGSYYLTEDRDEEGLIFFEKLLQQTDSSDGDITGVLNTRIGHIYSKKKDFRTSLKYNQKALDIRRRKRATPEINSSLINIAGDYYNLEKPDSGKIYMDSGLNLAYKHDRKNLIENSYRHLYLYNLRHHNFEKALEFYARYSTVHDDINYEENKNNIAILEANQKLQHTQQSGKAIASKHNIQALNIKYQKYQSSILLIMIGLASCSMIVFVLLLLYIRMDRRKMQRLHYQLSNEIRERESMEMHTRENENQYKFITDNSVDFITHMDEHNHRIYASPAALNVYGFEQDEIITKSPIDLTHPDDQAYSEAKFTEMMETRSARQFIHRARKKDGTNFWVESILNPLFDPISGVYKGMVGVTRDIQERKTKDIEIMEGTRQKENLLKEIHHRVKNNFAILVSLINMQMAQTKNQELLQSLTNLQLRIRTMSLVHEMLYRSNDFEKISFPGYLRSLASVIAGTYNRRDIDLVVEADEVVMDIEASIPLGLIVNELLSNAYKHGFPDGRTGKIILSFKVSPDAGTYCLGLHDDGIGMPEGVKLEQFKTMGLQVVQILCAQIEGNLEVVNNPGASFTITFQKPGK